MRHRSRFCSCLALVFSLCLIMLVGTANAKSPDKPKPDTVAKTIDTFKILDSANHTNLAHGDIITGATADASTIGIQSPSTNDVQTIVRQNTGQDLRTAPATMTRMHGDGFHGNPSHDVRYLTVTRIAYC